MLVPFNFAHDYPTQKPNHYLVCPKNFCKATPDQISPILKLSSTQLKKKVAHIITNQPRTKLIEYNNKKHYYFYEQRSKVFKFTDYITVQIIPINENESSLAIYSQSKYGYYDFGINQKRIENWLNQIQK